MPGRWTHQGATPHLPRLNLDDEALLAEVAAADIVGIDAPFGFPEPFVDALTAWRAGEGWPTEEVRPLRFRLTDFAVYKSTGRWPLSVSSDLIALSAWRCARLLTRLGVTARDGSDRIVEVYPGAALTAWGFERSGYKSDPQARELLIHSMVERSTGWLKLDEQALAACIATDHALDALVAALVVRAASLGLTEKPPLEHVIQFPCV